MAFLCPSKDNSGTVFIRDLFVIAALLIRQASVWRVLISWNMNLGTKS